MTTRSLHPKLLVFALLPLIAGCVDDPAEDSAAAAEQACLTTHTDQGFFNFSGTRQQICGVKRQELAATLVAGGHLGLPAARFGLALDLNFTAVRLTEASGAIIEIAQLASGSACGNSLAWHFDSDLNPTKIVLCNGDASVKAGGAVFVDLLVGCGATSTTSAASPQVASGSSNANTTASCATGQCGTGSNCACGQCVSFGSITIGQCGASSTCATGSCGLPTNVAAGTCSSACYGQCGATTACTSGQCGATTTCTSGQCGATTTCTSGQCGATTACTSGQCGATTTCTSGQCGATTTCTSGQCGATTTCTSGQCGATTAWTGCSCLWNIIFLENGCTEPPKPSYPEPSDPTPSDPTPSGPVLL